MPTNEVVSSKQIVPITTSRGEVELWAPSQSFAVGQIITLSGGGEWSKYGSGSVDPKLDEATYDESVRYEEIPQPMFVVTAIRENGRVQARECNMGEVHDLAANLRHS